VKSSRRGAPLLFLATTVLGWIAVRAATYTPTWSDFPHPPSLGRGRVARVPVPAKAGITKTANMGADVVGWRTTTASFSGEPHPRDFAPAPGRSVVSSVADANLTVGMPLPNDAKRVEPEGRLSERQKSVQAARAPRLSSAAGPPIESVSGTSPWSADGWLLLRDGSAGPLAPVQPSYGRSQAGAVVRYQLSDTQHRPQAYLRGSASLAGAR
jgi:hypothetical protein